MRKEEPKNWKNWSGSLKFKPAGILLPESEEEIVELVRWINQQGKTIRVVGAGHSSTPLVRTGEYLMSLKHFIGSENIDLEKSRATVLAGMTVKDCGKELYRYGLAMHNTGDVDVQSLVGAIATGTHGTGKNLQNLSSMLVGVRMVTGTGEVVEAVVEEDPQLFKALRVALGTCGIFWKIRLQLQPAYHLFRKEWCVHIDDCLEHLEELQENNRNFDFYWYPRCDLAKIRVMNEKEVEMPNMPYGKLERDKQGPSHEILPRTRHIKFDEMEYSLPAENGPACFADIRELVKKKYRKEVAWRVLYRTIKKDDSFLSPAFGKDCVSISLHHNAGLPFEEYFNGIEPIFRKYGGKPHWGKKHNLKAEQLKELYPEWESFQKVREKFDPNGVFMTPYLNELLIGHI